MLFKLQFDSGDLIYELSKTSLAKKWWYQFSQRTIKDCETFNPDLRIKNEKNLKIKYDAVVERLEHLIWFLQGNGYHINGELNTDNMQESLNRLHEHFPINVKHQNNLNIKKALEEYNLVIHWLEASLSFHEHHELKACHLNLYFNNEKKYDILDEEFNFTVDIKNGDITCAYPQAGKHFTEIVSSKDYNIPKKQIWLHEKWSANCNITFYYPPEKFEISKKYFIIDAKNTYDNMGGKKTFGYDFTDRKMAIGWLPLASLVHDDLSIFDNATKILGWEKC